MSVKKGLIYFVPKEGHALFEVHAIPDEKYKKFPSYEYLGTGYVREVTVPSLTAAHEYCTARGLFRQYGTKAV